VGYSLSLRSPGFLLASGTGVALGGAGKRTPYGINQREQVMALEARILVVDDEPVVCTSCERLLAMDGYRVRSAHSSAAALRILERCRYDLVLLDLRLPGPGGLTLLRTFRSEFPEMEVIVVTGHATIENAVESIQLGATEYLQKPLDPNRIRSAVSEALARKHATPIRRC